MTLHCRTCGTETEPGGESCRALGDEALVDSAPRIGFGQFFCLTKHRVEKFAGIALAHDQRAVRARNPGAPTALLLCQCDGKTSIFHFSEPGYFGGSALDHSGSSATRPCIVDRRTLAVKLYWPVDQSLRWADPCPSDMGSALGGRS
jgi:hypothetical protein